MTNVQIGCAINDGCMFGPQEFVLIVGSGFGKFERRGP